MGADTEIAWCDSTFNPVIGCTKVDELCTHCYAESQDHRWGHDSWGPGKPRRRTSEAYWKQPLRWNAAAEKAGTRRRVFCASLADVLDPEWPVGVREDLFRLIDSTPNLDWLLLTKRPENWQALTGGWMRDVRPNVWWGTSVGTQKSADKRIPELLQIPAAVRFLSCEPLLSAVDLRLQRGWEWATPDQDTVDLRRPLPRISWVICGGESGPKARPFDLEWARSILRQCAIGGAACFIKQLGDDPVQDSAAAAIHGSLEGVKAHHGADPAEWPADLRVRQFPEVTRG